jgi:hypothetical protein
VLAVLPTTGAELSLVDMRALGNIDAALRDALLLNNEIALQPSGVTQDSFKSTRAAGVTCRVSDRECLRKVALLSGVELLIVPVAAVADGGFEVELTLLDVASPASARVSAVMPARGKQLDEKARALVDELFRAPRTLPASPSTTAAVSPPPPAATDAPAPPAPAPVRATTTATTATATTTTTTTTATTATTTTTATTAPAAAEDGGVWWLVAGGTGAVLLTAAIVGGVVLALAPGAGGGGDDDDPPAATTGSAVVVLP